MAGAVLEESVSGHLRGVFSRPKKDLIVVVTSKHESFTIRKSKVGASKMAVGEREKIPLRVAGFKAVQLKALEEGMRMVPAEEEKAPEVCRWKDVVIFAFSTMGWSWSNTLLQHWTTSGHAPSWKDIPMLIKSPGSNRMARARLGLLNDWLSSLAYVATSDGLMEKGVPEPIAVALGTAASCLCTVPAGNIMQQLKVGGRSSLLGASKSLFKAQGLQGVFQGLGQVVASSAPMITIMVCTYMSLKNKVEKENGGRNIDGQKAAMAGGVAGAASVVGVSALTVAGRSISHTIRHKRQFKDSLLQQTSPSALQAIGTSMLVEAATSAVFFMVYEIVHVIIYNKHESMQSQGVKVPGGRVNGWLNVAKGLTPASKLSLALPVSPKPKRFAPAFACIGGDLFRGQSKKDDRILFLEQLLPPF